MSANTHKREPYDFGASISQPFQLPGGMSFLARIVIASSLLLTLVYLAFGRTIVAAYIEFFQVAMTMEDPEDPEALSAIMNSMTRIIWPMMGLWLGSWLVMASTETAFHLNRLKGIDRGLFPLRFGMPELGVWAAQLVVGLIVFGVYFAGYLVLMVILIVAAFSAEAGGNFSGIGAAIGFVAMMAWFAAMTVAAIRLSPAAALSVQDGDIRTIEGWTMTDGRFWTMFGGYVILSIVGNFAFFIVMVIAFFIAFGSVSTFAPLGGIGENSDPQQVFAALRDMLYTPRVIIGSIIGGFMMMVFNVLWRSFMWGIPNYVVQLDTLNDADENVFS